MNIFSFKINYDFVFMHFSELAHLIIPKFFIYNLSILFFILNKVKK